MDKNLRIEYDEPSDTLHIELCAPYAEQTFDDIDDGVLGRFNPMSGAIESIEVLFFRGRLKEEGHIEIPVTADFKLAIQADV